MVGPAVVSAFTLPQLGHADDPLGVRADSPIVNNKICFNSAYVAPNPKQVVAAGKAFKKIIRQPLIAFGLDPCSASLTTCVIDELHDDTEFALNRTLEKTKGI